MKISILLIALAVTAPHLPRIEGNKDDTGGSLHWKSNGFQDSHLANGRFRKDSGDDYLKTSVSNLQMIARITNAIYVQQGLIAGTIPPDALISELLHFGSVKPSDIATLDTDKIRTAVNTLKELPVKLKPGDEVVDVEKWLTSVEGIVKDIKGLGSIEKWSSTGLVDEINKLKSGVLPTVVSKVKEAAAKWVANHMDAAAEETTAKVLLTQLIKPLETIKSALNDVSTMKPLYTFKGVSNAVDMMRPIFLANIGVQNYLSRAPDAILDQGKEKPYFAYLDLITTEAGPHKEIEPSVDVVRRLLESPRALADPQFTTGFPEGPSDLAKVHNDLKDVWIRKVINSTSFPMALDKLKDLEGPLKSVHEVITSGDVVDHGASIPTAVENLNRLVSKFEMLKSGITVGQGCVRPTLASKPDYSKVKVLEGHLESIDHLLGNMTIKTNSLIQYLQDAKIEQWCDDVIKICEEAESANDINLVMTKFKAYANIGLLTESIEKIAELAKAVVDVQDFGSKPTGKTIQKEAGKAEKLITELDIYHTKVKMYSKYFDCLQKKEVFMALETAELVKALRTNDPSRVTFLDNGMEAIKKVAETKDLLKKLKIIISDQKSIKSPETKGLALFKDGSTHSKTIGLAVQGVSNMNDALEKRTDLENLLKVKDVIHKNQKKLKDPEDAKNLNSLLTLLDEIQKMLSSLDTFKKSVVPSKSTILADYSLIFQNAKSVSGASGDYLTISATVGKFKELVTDPGEKKNLEDVESTLKTMDSMGLDFVKFQKSFDGSKSSLSALDAFFTSFVKQMVKVAKKEAKERKEQIFLILCILGGIVLFGAVVGVHVFIYKCYRYIWNQIYCFRRKRTDDYYLLMVLNHFKKAINVYVEANKNDTTAVVSSNKVLGYGLYFGNAFQTDNTNCLVAEEKCMEKNIKESLNGEHLLKKSRVILKGFGSRFSDGYYHANYFKLLNGRTMILAQTALHGFEASGKASTAAKFWWMVSQEKSKRIFMLNPLTYGSKDIVYSPYFPFDEGEKLTFGDIVVTCTKIKMVKNTDKDYKDKTDFEKQLVTRELTVKIGNGKEFTVTHHWIPFWCTGFIPSVPGLVSDLVKLILDAKDKTPPIIHCGDGISETGIVAFVAYCVTMVTVTEEVNFAKALKKLRDSRADSVLTKWAYGFAAIVFIEYFNPEKSKNEYIKEKFESMFNGFKDFIKPPPQENIKKPQEKIKNSDEKEKSVAKKIKSKKDDSSMMTAVAEQEKPEESKMALQDIMAEVAKHKLTSQPPVLYVPDAPPYDSTAPKEPETIEEIEKLPSMVDKLEDQTAMTRGERKKICEQHRIEMEKIKQKYEEEKKEREKQKQIDDKKHADQIMGLKKRAEDLKDDVYRERKLRHKVTMELLENEKKKYEDVSEARVNNTAFAAKQFQRQAEEEQKAGEQDASKKTTQTEESKKN